MSDSILALMAAVAHEFVGASVRASPVYLAAAAVIAYLVFRTRRIRGGFAGWLLPKHIITHRSHLTDFKLYVANRLLAATRILTSVSLTTVTATAVLAVFGRGAAASDIHPVLLAILIAVVSDFGVYWVHRWHHRLPVLWPFHAVHHSAEVLTPITVYRKHPVYDVLSTLGKSALIGLLLGSVLAVVAGNVDIAIAGANAVYVAFNAAGSNLRHSHLWLSYGKSSGMYSSRRPSIRFTTVWRHGTETGTTVRSSPSGTGCSGRFTCRARRKPFGSDLRTRAPKPSRNPTVRRPQPSRRHSGSRCAPGAGRRLTRRIDVGRAACPGVSRSTWTWSGWWPRSRYCCHTSRTHGSRTATT